MSELERNLDFEVKDSEELNAMLTGVLMDVRRGNLEPEMVRGITLVADKINKNNVNAIEYKKISKHKKELPFFVEGLKN